MLGELPVCVGKNHKTGNTTLFVCVENAGRSQMAEAEKFGISAISAGTMPASKVNPTVVQAMKEMGFDIFHRRFRRDSF